MNTTRISRVSFTPSPELVSDDVSVFIDGEDEPAKLAAGTFAYAAHLAGESNLTTATTTPDGATVWTAEHR